MKKRSVRSPSDDVIGDYRCNIIRDDTRKRDEREERRETDCLRDR